MGLVLFSSLFALVCRRCGDPFVPSCLAGLGDDLRNSVTRRLPTSLALRSLAGDLEVKQVTNCIRDCSSAKEALNIMRFTISKPYVDLILVDAVFVKLAKTQKSFTPQMVISEDMLDLVAKARDLLRTGGATGSGVTANMLQSVALLREKVQMLMDKLLPALIGIAAGTGDDMQPYDVARTFWATATLRNVAPDMDVKILPRLMDVVPRLAKVMNGHDVANMFWAIATLRKSPVFSDLQRLLPVLAAAAQRNVKTMTTQEISNCIWGAGVMHEESPEIYAMMDTLCDEAIKRMRISMVDRSLGAKGLMNYASITWGVALLSWRCDAWMDAIADLVVNFADEGRKLFTRKDIAVWLPRIVCAFAKLKFRGARMEAMLNAAAELIEPQIVSLNPWGLSALAWSCKELGVETQLHMFSSLLREEARRRGITNQSIALSQFGPDEWYASD